MNCLIRLLSSAAVDGVTDSSETAVRGEVTELPESSGVRFDFRTIEGEAPGTEIRNVIEVSGDRAVVRRIGPIKTKITVIPGEKTAFQYETPYGAFTFAAVGREVGLVREENRIVAELTYDLTDGETLISEHTVRVEAEG